MMDQSYQKAAKLLIALDPTTARTLLSFLNEEETEQINTWLEKIDAISNEEADQLLKSFYLALEENSLYSTKTNQLILAIEKEDPKLIERLLKKESPRAIATLLPFLSIKTVNNLLFFMDDHLAALIISEAAHLEPKEIEKAKNTLEKTWGPLPPSKFSYGLTLVEEWYQSLHEERKKQLQKVLHQIDPELKELLLHHVLGSSI